MLKTKKHFQKAICGPADGASDNLVLLALSPLSALTSSLERENICGELALYSGDSYPENCAEKEEFI